MLNKCFMENKITTCGGNPRLSPYWSMRRIPNSYQPISLLWHTYTLYEIIIQNRIAPTIEQHLIKDHAGFRPRKSCTSQLLNLTQHIEVTPAGLSTNPRVTTLCVCRCSCKDYVSCVYECYKGGIVVMGVIWRRLCVNMIKKG